MSILRANNNIIDDYESGNNPPNVASNPQPGNYANDIPLNTNLQWSCSDPNDDDLSYKVYFGTTNPPPFVGTTDNTATYALSGLLENTTYFWYIEAFDPSGLSSISPVWEFTTESGGGSNGCDGITSIDYEGQTYHTIEFGEQCWFRENLNAGAQLQSGQTPSNDNIIEKYCYENEASNCESYGGLYKWGELMQYSEQEGVQGICPDGWHIPTELEWNFKKSP